MSSLKSLIVILILSLFSSAAYPNCFDYFSDSSSPLQTHKSVESRDPVRKQKVESRPRVEEPLFKTPEEEISAFENVLSQIPIEQHMNVGIKTLVSGSESLAARLALIERAQKSIDISYYIFRDDMAGRAIIAALRDALRRGVDVRILVDGIGSYHPTQIHMRTLLLSNLHAEGQVIVKIVHPLASVRSWLYQGFQILSGKARGFDIGAINRRAHGKVLLVDAGTENSWAIVGGKNISEDQFALAGPEREILDYEILIKGGLLGENDPLKVIERDYEVLFNYRLSRMLDAFSIWTMVGKSTYQRTVEMMDARDTVEMMPAIREHLETMRNENYWKDGFEATKTAFLSDVKNLVRQTRVEIPGAPDSKGHVTISRSVFIALKHAKKSFEMISPYALFSKAEVEEIRQSLLENPEKTFTLYTNSLKSTDQKLVYALFRFSTLKRLRALQNDPLIGDRVKIYLYNGSNLLHAKLVIVDGVASLVTTANFDPRSNIFNAELGLWENSQTNQAGINQLRSTIINNSILLTKDTAEPDTVANTPRERLTLAYLKFISRLFMATGMDQLF